MRSLAGHAGSGACSLAFSPDGAAALSCAPGDRALALWDVSPAGGATGAKAAPAASRLALGDGTPLQVAASAAPGCARGAFYACCVSQLGEAFVWLCDGAGGAQGAPRRLRVGAPTPSHGSLPLADCVLAAAVQADGASGACAQRAGLCALFCAFWGTVLFSVASRYTPRRPPVTQCHSHSAPARAASADAAPARRSGLRGRLHMHRWVD